MQDGIKVGVGAPEAPSMPWGVVVGRCGRWIGFFVLADAAILAVTTLRMRADHRRDTCDLPHSRAEMERHTQLAG